MFCYTVTDTTQGNALGCRLNLWVPDFLFAPGIHTCKVKDIVREVFFFPVVRLEVWYRSSVASCWKAVVGFMFSWMLISMECFILHSWFCLILQIFLLKVYWTCIYWSVLIWHFNTGCSRISSQMRELWDLPYAHRTVLDTYRDKTLYVCGTYLNWDVKG